MKEGYIPYGYENARDWICTCGKRPFDGGIEKWRWDGKNWQHHHTYPVGHLVCEYKPCQPKPNKEKKDE